MSNKSNHSIKLFLLLLLIAGCSNCSTPSEGIRPIANPFANYKAGPNGETGQPMILRTKKGDRSVEVEIPGDSQRLSDFVLPMSPTFKDSMRSPSSTQDSKVNEIDDSYRNKSPSFSDREITQNLPHGLQEDLGRQKNIEEGLNLAPSEDESSTEGASSYLAALDRIKQLYRNARYEAALLETDEMIKQFQTDSKLYEMRGTLLSRMGRHELALKSWNQALRFDPKNEALKKFIGRRQLRSSMGGS